MPNRDIVVIGASAGGVETLKALVGLLPTNLPASIFVVVHFPATSVSVLPDILNRTGPLLAAHAKNHEQIQPGRIYVSVPNFHLTIADEHLRLTSAPAENGHRPAVDTLFRSAARALGPRVVGVILSGTLDDGTAGLLDLKAHGGITIAQSPAEALFPDMPRNAIESGRVDYVLPVTEIAKLIIQMSQTPLEEPLMSANGNNGGSDLESQEVLAVQGDLDAQANGERAGLPSVLTCPDCGGVLWEFDNEEVVQYRCHVGHVYSAESMLDKQDGALETALWTALRTLVENATLARRLARRANGRGFHRAAERFDHRAREADAHAETLRRVLAQGHTDPQFNTAEQSA